MRLSCKFSLKPIHWGLFVCLRPSRHPSPPVCAARCFRAQVQTSRGCTWARDILGSVQKWWIPKIIITLAMFIEKSKNWWVSHKLYWAPLGHLAASLRDDPAKSLDIGHMYWDISYRLTRMYCIEWYNIYIYIYYIHMYVQHCATASLAHSATSGRQFSSWLVV